MESIEITVDLSIYSTKELNTFYLQGVISDKEYSEELSRREEDKG